MLLPVHLPVNQLVIIFSHRVLPASPRDHPVETHHWRPGGQTAEVLL